MFFELRYTKNGKVQPCVHALHSSSVYVHVVPPWIYAVYSSRVYMHYIAAVYTCIYRRSRVHMHIKVYMHI